jgi:hypothetical protein
VILAGVANGHFGAPFCRIADSYKDRHYCGRSCENKHYRNRSEVKERTRNRYQTDAAYREKVLVAQAVSRQSDEYKQKQADYHRDWRERNKEARAAYQMEWSRHKRDSDLNHRLKGCLRHRVHQAIKHGYKSAPTLELIGCTIDEVRAHLEAQFLPGMTWDNWTSNGWHIDHIQPCATFDLTDQAQQRECFHWSNLQPLWASDNCAKRDNPNWAPSVRIEVSEC